MSISNSLPHVVQGDSGHEESDGEVASVPFTGHEKEGEKRIRGSVQTDFNRLYCGSICVSVHLGKKYSFTKEIKLILLYLI